MKTPQQIRNEVEKEKIEKKIKEVKKQIERLDNNTMITIKISGIIKQRIVQIVDTPIEKELSVNEYLFRDNKLKKEFIQNIINEFPKGSIIEVKEVTSND
jgi:ferritin-like metal-binding protein YciE